MEAMDSQVEGFRLSPPQRQLWRLQHGDDAAGYRVQCALLLEGDLDADALRGALQAVAAQHEILRTRFRCLPGTSVAVQVIDDRAGCELQTADLTELDAAGQEAALAELMEADRRCPLSVGSGPSLSARLVVLGNARHVLVLTMPAMGSDAQGVVNLARALGAEYGAGEGDSSSSASGDSEEDGPMQYADLAEWQNELLEDAEQAFDPPRGTATVELSLINGSPGGEFAPAMVRAEIDPAVAGRIASIAAECGVAESTFYLTCWRELLGRLAEGDLVLGVVCDGRSYEGLDRALGLFARELPLAGRLDPAMTVEDALRATEVAAADLLERTEYFSWDRGADSHKNGAPAPFFALSFGFEDRSQSFEAAGIKFSIHSQYACTHRFALQLGCVRHGDAVWVELRYDSGRCAAEDAERLADLLRVLLASAVAAKTTAVGELSMLGAAERQRLVVDLNQTAVECDTDRCIHDLIEEHVASRPDAVAVVCGEHELSYSDLHRRAGALAARLVELGVGPDAKVCLCVERSVELAVGILGIHLAGGAYVPMDPGYPRDRLEFMLEDTAAPVVVCQGHLRDRLGSHGAAVVELESCADDDVAAPSGRAKPDDLAYIIYTSGSTGKPKGVEVTHRNLVHSTVARRHVYDSAPERYLLLSSFGFDSSVVGIFWTLCEGGTLVVPAEGTERDLHEITRLIRERAITHTLALPSLWSVILRETRGEGLSSLRTVMVAGEACPRELVQLHGEHVARAALYNEYGPTEATVWSTVHRCEGGGGERKVPIGRPIPNAQVYVLDAAMQPVPAGVPGELYVGGAGVTRGYLHRPELTAEKFVDDPFAGEGRLYRTGDLVRYLSNGDLEFLGRVDNQVKIRGYRIELEEIEDVLSGAAAVGEAVVVARQDAGGDLYLAGYVVPAGTDRPAPQELQIYLAERLPEYMVPASFSVLDDLPRMPNGKVDRSALPEPGGRAAAAEYVAPGDVLQQVLAKMWSELLKVERVGLHDNFFQLGGHSLLVTQLVFRLREVFAVEVPLRMIFDKPTLGELSALLTEDSTQRERLTHVARGVLE